MPASETPVQNEPESLAELVRRAQAGDDVAFGELMQAHYEPVFRLVYSILRHEEDARDVCQEVWLKAWQNIGTFRGDSKLTTWLHPIAVRRSIDWVRKRRRWYDHFVPFRSEVDEPEDERHAAPEPVAEEPGPAETAEAKERKLRFERALAALPPKHRAVLALREIEGLSYAEIATAVKCRVGTVMSRLHHARRMLVRKLGDPSCE